MTLDDMAAVAAQYTLDGLRSYGYVTRNDLGLRVIHNASVTARTYYPDRSYVGAVYDGRNELIGATQRFNDRDIFPVDPHHLDDIAAASMRPATHGLALYGGILFPILGHFFFESISRLWPLLWQHASDGQSMPVYFHPWPGLDTATFLSNPLYRESLAAFGIGPENLVVIERPTRIDQLVVADTASAYHLNLDQQMIPVFDRIATNILGQDTRRPVQTGPGRQVYLSRSQWLENTRIINEVAIDAEMSARGFEVIHTQTMAPRELMSMLVDADVLVSCDGSHAHLAAFCRPGIQAIILDTRPVPTQFAISVLRRMKAVHVPLFQMPIYRMEFGITDPAALGTLIDVCLQSTRT